MAEDIEEQIIQLNKQQAQLYQEGRYKQALDIARNVYALAEQYLGQDHRYVADSLNNLAVIFMEMGRYAEAEPLYLKALEIYRRVLAKGDPDITAMLSNLASCYELMGNYAKAEPLLREALQITQAALGEHDSDYAFSLNNLALFYYKRLGRYEEAEPLFRRAVKIYRKLGMEMDLDFANTLNNLAGLYESMGQYAAARPLYRRALRIVGALQGEDHPAYATGLNNLAYLYESMGRYAAAERLSRRALEIRQAVWGDSHPDVADSLHNLAEVYQATGRYARAELFARRSLAARRQALGELHPDVAQSLHGLAGLCAATDRVPDALALMNEAAAINDWMIGQAFSLGSEQQRMEYLATMQGNFAGFLSLVYHYQADVLPAIRLSLDLVLRRKAIGAEALAAQRDAVLGGHYPSLASKLKALNNLRTRIAQETLAGPGTEGLEAYGRQLSAWNAERERLEAELARHVPEINLERQLRAADRHSVCRALPGDSALIEFVLVPIFNFKAAPARGEPRWLPAHYLAFVLPSGEPDNVKMIALGEADAIDRRISAFRMAITGEGEGSAEAGASTLPLPTDHAPGFEKPEERIERHVSPVSRQPVEGPYLQEGSALREVVFDSLVPALQGYTRLFLAPDGDLARLPFEVLPGHDGRHLIDVYHISYLSVGRDLLRLDKKAAVQSTVPLVVADPDFDLRGEGPTDGSREDVPGRLSPDLGQGVFHFARLGGTRVEGMHIAARLGVSPLLGQAALEESLKTCRSPYILHLATHGFFLPDQPPAEVEAGGGGGRLSQRLENPLLRSGLALAGANTWLRGGVLPPEAEDGLLTAEDVSGLDLLETELVVLSACETGLGQVQIGEGVFGLRRAFMLAGARTLVMSLWKVPDHETQQLMEYFYQSILKGHHRADALREAQLALKAAYPRPHYWGAFICQGDPGPLSQ